MYLYINLNKAHDSVAIVARGRAQASFSDIKLCLKSSTDYSSPMSSTWEERKWLVERIKEGGKYFKDKKT